MIEKIIVPKVSYLSTETHEDSKKAMMPIYLSCVRMLNRRPVLGLNFEEESGFYVIIYNKNFIQERNGFHGDRKSDLIIEKTAKQIMEDEDLSTSPIIDTYSFCNIFEGERYVLRRIVGSYPCFGYTKMEEAGKQELEELAELVKKSNEYREWSGNDKGAGDNSTNRLQ
jgi:hypothetical protein